MSSLEELKAQADEMGLKYNGNISATTLQDRINKALAGDTQDEEEVVTTSVSANPVAEMRKQATRLIRVTLTSMDVLKRDYRGEFFEVSNRVLKVKRFIPYGVPTHIEAILLEEIRNRKFRMTIPATRESGAESRLVTAYAIQELPPLTDQELKNLAKAQQARNSIE